MSLDVYLMGDAPPEKQYSGIFIREDGAMREISGPEWEERFPGREPTVATGPDIETVEPVFSRNITHNLVKMADAAGIYEAMWRPENIGATKAKDLIEPLSNGLEKLKADRDSFTPFNPENGWGNYDGLVAFVASYLDACREHPKALIRVSR